MQLIPLSVVQVVSAEGHVCCENCEGRLLSIVNQVIEESVLCQSTDRTIHGAYSLQQKGESL